jgi:predicted outer membrane protein
MVDEEFIEKPRDHIHHFGNNEPKESWTFLIKDEHDNFVSQEEEDDGEDLVEEESEDYQKAYLNVMMDFQKQYNLRRRNVVVDPPKKAPEGQASASHPARNLLKRVVV